MKSNEIAYQLKDCGAAVILTLDAFYEENVRDALLTGDTDVKLVITTNVADLLNLNPIVKFLGKITIWKGCTRRRDEIFYL